MSNGAPKTASASASASAITTTTTLYIVGIGKLLLFYKPNLRHLRLGPKIIIIIIAYLASILEFEPYPNPTCSNLETYKSSTCLQLLPIILALVLILSTGFRGVKLANLHINFKLI